MHAFIASEARNSFRARVAVVETPSRVERAATSSVRVARPGMKTARAKVARAHVARSVVSRPAVVARLDPPTVAGSASVGTDSPAPAANSAPSRPARPTLLADPTLRKGDIVVTERGLRVFQGDGDSAAHSAKDFVRLASSDRHISPVALELERALFARGPAAVAKAPAPSFVAAARIEQRRSARRAPRQTTIAALAFAPQVALTSAQAAIDAAIREDVGNDGRKAPSPVRKVGIGLIY